MLFLDSSTTTNEFSAGELENAVAEWERLQFANPLFVSLGDVPTSDWWQITHASSDASFGATKLVVSLALEILKAAPKGRIQEAIENGDVAGALALFDWGAYEASLNTGLTGVFQTIGIRSGADTAIEIGKGIDYDETGFLKEAARGARIVSARITKSTRRATSDSLRRLMGSGTMSPRQVGIQIFSLLGLDPVQANAGVSKIIAQREAGTSLTKVGEATATFADKARDQREERIARFENLNAAQTAQEDAVKQHVDVRAINNVVKVWVIVPDNSTCPICNRLSGQRQIEGDSFTDPLTGLTYIGPPAHQACRCGLRYLEARKDTRATGVFVVDIRVPNDDGSVTVAREDLQARIFGGKHDQKTHGRKGPRSGRGGGGGGGGGGEEEAGGGGGGGAGSANIDGVLDGKGINKQEVIDGAQGKLSKLKTVKTLPNGDELVNHPIPQLSSTPPSFRGASMQGEALGLQQVDVSDLRSFTQKTVVREIVSTKIDNIFGAGGPLTQGPIFVVKVGNKLLIADGHHRATAAILSGKKTIKARVFETPR